MGISLIDKNFKTDSEIDKRGLKFYSPDEKPFRLFGVSRIGDRYRRIPEEIAAAANPGVKGLHANTAGGRVRFVTDSTKVAIVVRLDKVEYFNHMPLTGVAGFDIYSGTQYAGTFRPPYPMPDSAYESVVTLGDRRERTVTVNFPLYADVCELYIGLDENASVKPAPDYTYKKPVVYYGSSITQGGCASRPGNSYEAVIERELDTDYINLGFSGSARGETCMAEYISKLDMSVFVLDYDHNAPTPEHLKATHEPFYKTVRAANPDLPIILVSRPRYVMDDNVKARLAVIEETYRNALSAGDKNVYLVRGCEFFTELGNDYSVDGCHPTDLGFRYMARALAPVIAHCLKSE